MVQVNNVAGLRNKVLAITRNEYNAREFSSIVEEEGGRVIALPTIELVSKGSEPVKEFLDKLQRSKHDYCAFMSPQAVNMIFEAAGREAVLVLKSTVVIAVGPKTKQALEENGVHVRLMPDTFSSEGLVELLSSMDPAGKTIIIPRSGAANELANKSLKDLRMQVDEVILYTVQTSPITYAWKDFTDLLQQKKIDAIIFTSSSTVNSFFEIMEKILPDELQLDDLTKVISIGPFTTKELKRRKVKCFQAKQHTVIGALEIAKKII